MIRTGEDVTKVSAAMEATVDMQLTVFAGAFQNNKDWPFLQAAERLECCGAVECH